jgi:ABC-type transport system involved in multi-copper enzyme maturation permease subunit
MTGLLRKIVLETRWPVLCFSAGLCAIMAMLTWVLPTMLGDIEKVFDAVPFIKPLIAALLGVDPDRQFSAEMTQAFLWVHPTVLSTIWGHEIMYCTRTPAAEIDRGTVDFLLGLPVSRWKLFLAETVGWLVSGFLIICTGILGHVLVAQQYSADMRPTMAVTAMILANLFSMYITVGAIAFLISSISDRRNKAMGGIFALLLFSFLVNFLARFWEPAQSWARISVLEYYRPATVIRDGVFPLTNVAILLSVGFVCWFMAGTILRRRSICTV